MKSTILLAFAGLQACAIAFCHDRTVTCWKGVGWRGSTRTASSSASLNAPDTPSALPTPLSISTTTTTVIITTVLRSLHTLPTPSSPPKSSSQGHTSPHSLPWSIPFLRPPFTHVRPAATAAPTPLNEQPPTPTTPAPAINAREAPPMVTRTWTLPWEWVPPEFRPSGWERQVARNTRWWTQKITITSVIPRSRARDGRGGLPIPFGPPPEGWETYEPTRRRWQIPVITSDLYNEPAPGWEYTRAKKSTRTTDAPVRVPGVPGVSWGIHPKTSEKTGKLDVPGVTWGFGNPKKTHRHPSLTLALDQEQPSETLMTGKDPTDDAEWLSEIHAFTDGLKRRVCKEAGYCLPSMIHAEEGMPKCSGPWCADFAVFSKLLNLVLKSMWGPVTEKSCWTWTEDPDATCFTKGSLEVKNAPWCIELVREGNEFMAEFGMLAGLPRISVNMVVDMIRCPDT